jgi:hypothetical protein
VPLGPALNRTYSVVPSPSTGSRHLVLPNGWEGQFVSANVVGRVPTWRTLMWTGVVGSVLAWGLAWYVARGAATIMVFVALTSVVFAFRSSRMRRALAGLMIAGFTMFLASVYWMYLLGFSTGGQVPVGDMLTLSVFPMVAAVVLLLGAVSGFRHTAPDRAQSVTQNRDVPAG